MVVERYRTPLNYLLLLFFIFIDRCYSLLLYIITPLCHHRRIIDSTININSYFIMMITVL